MWGRSEPHQSTLLPPTEINEIKTDISSFFHTFYWVIFLWTTLEVAKWYNNYVSSFIQYVYHNWKLCYHIQTIIHANYIVINIVVCIINSINNVNIIWRGGEWETRSGSNKISQGHKSHQVLNASFHTVFLGMIHIYSIHI